MRNPVATPAAIPVAKEAPMFEEPEVNGLLRGFYIRKRNELNKIEDYVYYICRSRKQHKDFLNSESMKNLPLNPQKSIK